MAQWRPWTRREGECGWASSRIEQETGWGVAQRGWIEKGVCYPPSTGFSMGACGCRSSDAGWLFRSRGHGTYHVRVAFLGRGCGRGRGPGEMNGPGPVSHQPKRSPRRASPHLRSPHGPSHRPLLLYAGSVGAAPVEQRHPAAPSSQLPACWIGLAPPQGSALEFAALLFASLLSPACRRSRISPGDVSTSSRRARARCFFRRVRQKHFPGHGSDVDGPRSPPAAACRHSRHTRHAQRPHHTLLNTLHSLAASRAAVAVSRFTRPARSGRLQLLCLPSFLLLSDRQEYGRCSRLTGGAACGLLPAARRPHRRQSTGLVAQERYQHRPWLRPLLPSVLARMPPSAHRDRRRGCCTRAYPESPAAPCIPSTRFSSRANRCLQPHLMGTRTCRTRTPAAYLYLSTRTHVESLPLPHLDRLVRKRRALSIDRRDGVRIHCLPDGCCMLL